MKLSLMVTKGTSEGKAISITVPEFVIGRDPKCHLRPASVMISKRHCAVLVRAGKVFVRDFDSTNGTFVNDQPLKGEIEVNHLDNLRAGPLCFQVQIVLSAPVAKPAPVPESTMSEDDEIASMLLDMNDDVEPTKQGPLSSEDIPTESTVLDMNALQPKTTIANGQTPGKPGVKPAASGNTRNAAEEILAKYSRRNRK